MRVVVTTRMAPPTTASGHTSRMAPVPTDHLSKRLAALVEETPQIQLDLSLGPLAAAKEAIEQHLQDQSAAGVSRATAAISTLEVALAEASTTVASQQAEASQISASIQAAARTFSSIEQSTLGEAEDETGGALKDSASVASALGLARTALSNATSRVDAATPITAAFIVGNELPRFGALAVEATKRVDEAAAAIDAERKARMQAEKGRALNHATLELAKYVPAHTHYEPAI